MTKREAFTRDDENRRQLAAVMPVVLAALEVVKDELEKIPSVDPVTVNPQIGNNHYQQIVGIRKAITDLPGLTKEAKPVKQPEPRRQFTEADREALENEMKGGK